MPDNTDHPAATDADVRNLAQHMETFAALDHLTALYTDLVSVVAELRGRIERIERPA